MLLFAGQTLCAAIGLELYERQLKDQNRARASDQVMSDMHAFARRWIDSNAVRARPAPSAPTRSPTVHAWVPATPPDVTIVDSDWKPVASGSAAGTPAPADRQRAPLRWQPDSAAHQAYAPASSGTVTSSGDACVALAWPLDDGSGYVVFSRPAAAVAEIAGATFADSFPLRLIALAWTSGTLFVVAYLILARFHETVQRQRGENLVTSLKQTQQLARTRDGVIFALAKLAESRDPETGDHLERIATYSRALAEAAHAVPRFAPQLNAQFVRLIGLSSALHDIGKVGLEDAILLKRGPLSAEERRRMERHTQIAGDCLGEISRRVGDSTFLQMARSIALAHHERWDGSGYPRGLRGEEIPLAARIVAIADVYDALRTRRVYKPALTHEETVARIIESGGTHFDPELVTVFKAIAQEFDRISKRYEVGPLGDPVAPPESGPSGLRTEAWTPEPESAQLSDAPSVNR